MLAAVGERYCATPDKISGERRRPLTGVEAVATDASVERVVFRAREGMPLPLPLVEAFFRRSARCHSALD